MQFPSKTIEEAVTEISRLPGIGKKSALRLALHLLKMDESVTVALTNALVNLKTKTRHCSICFHITDSEICAVCSSSARDKSLICIVEDSKDVIAIENTGQYNGLYHVLGGVISPVNGVGPEKLSMELLMKRFSFNEIKEVVLGISPTMDGDTTGFYISKKLKGLGIRISTIARGIPIGGELEYTDEITLGRSILRRISYDQV